MAASDELDGARRRRHATIADVAEVAGVAVGTVSRYLNGLPVRALNRGPIEEAIRSLNFERSSAAVSMAKSSSSMIGFMMPGFSDFHGSLLESLTRKLRQHGLAVISYSHDRDPTSIEQGIRFFTEHRVEAIVIDGDEGARPVLQRRIEDGLPVVLYDHDLAGLDVDRVFMENTKSARRLVDHLAELGHRRIGTIIGLLENTGGRERFDGYLQSLQANGVELDERYVAPGFWIEDGGYAAMRELMELPDPPTAVFSANYNMTIGALRWLREHELSVPGDVSLVSFDDVAAFSVHSAGITAIEQPTERIAEGIARLLRDRFSSTQKWRPKTLRISGNVTLRRSAVSPRSGTDSRPTAS